MTPSRGGVMMRAAVLGGLLLVLSACGGSGLEDGRTELSIFAASSLTDAFTAVEAAFEAANPDVDVVSSFSGSQVLRLQIEQGARAHVFASANEDHARSLAASGLAAPPELLAYNHLVVIVPPDNPAGIETLADLASASRVVVASRTVPLGRYTHGMLERAGGPDFLRDVRGAIVSEENNARLVRAKVELGEADAAIVYRTDAISSDRVRAISLPDRLNFPARYAVTPLLDENGEVDAAAERFVRFLRSKEGRALLREYGFVTEVDRESR